MTYRPIPNYEGLYSITDDGRIWSHKREALRKNQLNQYGYETIILNKYGVAREYTVHSLVAAAFIGERPAGMTVNHKDGNKRNNRTDNLEYTSHGDNIRHAWALGLATKKVGERASRAKLTDVKAINIGHLYRSGIKQTQIAALYGMSQSGVSRVVTGSRFGHLAEAAQC